MSAMPVAVEDVEQEEPFDFAARVDALRCESTAVLRRMIDDARVEQERWRLEELAATRVLDDRGAPCHKMYKPHGPYRLVGDPNQPDGLRLVHRDDPDPHDLPRDGPSP